MNLICLSTQRTFARCKFNPNKSCFIHTIVRSRPARTCYWWQKTLRRGKWGYEAAFLLLLEEFSCDRSERENEVTLLGDLLES